MTTNGFKASCQVSPLAFDDVDLDDVDFDDVDFDNVDFETSGYKASDPSGQSRSLGHVLQPMVLRHQIRPPGMRHFL